jgi:aspartyl-tRNA(Asn)/glutamyl-tRNA(Gln) amidotransferase subunit A
MYAYDVFTTLANIAQIPAISVPVGEIDGKKLGMQIMADKWNEKMIFVLARSF